MPWTIYRYILKDLIRLFGSATSVLVLVISLAAAVKPLSEGLLGVGSFAKYVAFLSPTMLGFTAPFAAAFAGTMVYSRMAGDNEIVACRASGIGYGWLLIPALGVGVVMTATLFYLSNWVVPSFYHRATATLESDFTRVLVTQIEQGRTVNLGQMILYADAVDDSQPAPTIPGGGIQPTKLIRLQGVAAGRTDGYGRMRNDAIAREADLLFYHIEGQTWVTLRLRDLTYHDATTGDLVSVEQWMVPQVRLPTPFRDSPRFMSRSELKRLQEAPDRFDRVRERKFDLVEAVSREKVAKNILARFDPVRMDSIGTGGLRTLVLLGPHDGDQYTLHAHTCRRESDGLVFGGKDGGAVRFEYTREGLDKRVIEAREAVASIETGQVHPEPRIALELRDAFVYDPEGGGGTEHRELELPRARLVSAVTAPMKSMDSKKLLHLATAEYRESEPVTNAARRFRTARQTIVRKIGAQLHGRAALAISGTLVLLLSVVLSMGMGGSMPLVIYFWSFMPAVVVVIATRSGENLANDQGVLGPVMALAIWAGNAILAGCVAVLFARLNRA